jgi:hypothetical protein
MRSTVLGHDLGQQSSHAVADQDHAVEGRVRAVGVESPPGRTQVLPQQVGRVEEGSTRRVAERPELVALAQERVGFQPRDHPAPGPWAGREAVDQHDGVFSRGVGSGQREPGGLVRLPVTPGWSRSGGRNQGERRDRYQVDSGTHGLETPWARTAPLPGTTISALTIRRPQQTAASSTATRLVSPRSGQVNPNHRLPI